jgi:hypothetical protein
MSAIADFTVAVLDCPTCCRHFIENYVVVAMHRERVSCPHCGAHYGAMANADGAHSPEPPARHPRRPRSHLHSLGQRRKLH